jgi:hypothetical protein
MLQQRRNMFVMVVLVGLAAVYTGYLLERRDLPGGISPRTLGTIGVMLGLLICSRPAGHLLDLLLYNGYRRFSSPRVAAWWAAFNLMVLVIGCAVVMIGATRFATGRIG